MTVVTAPLPTTVRPPTTPAAATAARRVEWPRVVNRACACVVPFGAVVAVAAATGHRSVAEAVAVAAFAPVTVAALALFQEAKS